VPPLRDHGEDIPILARHFLAEYSAAYGRKPKELGEAALGVMVRYQWREVRECAT